ncbi:MAG: hypothetical protein IT281_04915 [Ignavibacteria bacterium]|nr:hypothetical protein [Ignavibacteria bacterium]
MEKDLCPICGGDKNFDYKPVKSLFQLWSDDESKPVVLPTAMKVFTGRLIKKFGYEAVREAFIQAGISKERMRLEYVRGILMKKEQQLKQREHMMQANELKKDNITTRSSTQYGNYSENNSGNGVVDEENGRS